MPIVRDACSWVRYVVADHSIWIGDDWPLKLIQGSCKSLFFVVEDFVDSNDLIILVGGRTECARIEQLAISLVNTGMEAPPSSSI